MIHQKLLKEIADQVINYGHEGEVIYINEEGTEYKIFFEKEDKEGFYFTIPDYEEEAFVEDKKMALMLDLSDSFVTWKRYKTRREGAKKTNAILKAKNPNHYREAAKKRWKR